MPTAGELRAEAQYLRDLAARIPDPQLQEQIQLLISELESRAREMEDGA
jgi:hypothetical protein